MHDETPLRLFSGPVRKHVPMAWIQLISTVVHGCAAIGHLDTLMQKLDGINAVSFLRLGLHTTISLLDAVAQKTSCFV
jgi:hypothetical protein